MFKLNWIMSSDVIKYSTLDNEQTWKGLYTQLKKSRNN